MAVPVSTELMWETNSEIGAALKPPEQSMRVLVKKRNKLFVGTILIKNGTLSMTVGIIAVR